MRDMEIVQHAELHVDINSSFGSYFRFINKYKVVYVYEFVNYQT